MDKIDDNLGYKYYERLKSISFIDKNSKQEEDIIVTKTNSDIHIKFKNYNSYINHPKQSFIKKYFIWDGEKWVLRNQSKNAKILNIIEKELNIDLSNLINYYENPTLNLYSSNDIFYIEFPYNEKIQSVLKSKFPIRWDKEKIAWTLPLTQLTNFVEFCKKHNLKLSLSQGLEIYLREKNNQINNLPSYLFPYQKEAVKFAIEKERIILADEMGLGKTVETLAFCDFLKLKTIIICPKTLIFHWIEHIQKFTSGNYVVLNSNLKNLPYELPQFTILNYEILKKFKEYLSIKTFDCIVLDEAHYIKNYKAKRTKIIKEIFDNVKHKILISGTPMKNRPADLFMLLNFIDRHSFPSFKRFAFRFCNPKEIHIGGGKYVWDFSGASNLDELENLLKNYMIRRTKKDVQKFLPEKQKIYQSLNWFDDNLKAEYKKAEIDFLNWLKDISIDSLTKAQRCKTLTKINYLKQITTADKTLFLKSLLEEIQKNGSSKYVIFSQYKKPVKFLYEKFKPISVIITGETKDREQQIKKFNEDKNIKFIFLTTQVGGIGISLTSADTVFFLDMLWSPSDHDQAESRVHRFGQKQNVKIYYLYIKNTIDEKILNLLKWKESVINKVITAEELIKEVMKNKND